MSFEDLNLLPEILGSLRTEGYTTPTPIQAQAIPSVLEGRDLLGCAQTGTGKTAAFAIPLLQLISEIRKKEKTGRAIKGLILTPTRELAVQIGESFMSYGKNLGLRQKVIFGGVSQNPQADALRAGVDIVIATPGRLLDLYDQRLINLSNVKFLVLDEADRMLDMGFIHDVKKIIEKLPKTKQTLLFSATMPNEIAKLASAVLINPIRIDITPVSSTVEKINQSVYYVDKFNKKNLLIHLLQDQTIASALVFTRTKHGADRVAKDINSVGIKAEAIHGNKSQNARQNSLNKFKANKLRVLVATDIASRGIDIDELSHVINFELPHVAEDYVHRIGRTGRAGASGIAISFCDPEEKQNLRGIIKLINKNISVVEDHPYLRGKPNQIQYVTEQKAPKSYDSSYENSDRRNDYSRRPNPRRKFGASRGQ